MSMYEILIFGVGAVVGLFVRYLLAELRDVRLEARQVAEQEQRAAQLLAVKRTTLAKPQDCDHDWRADPKGWKPSIAQNMTAMVAEAFGSAITTKQEVLTISCPRCGKTDARYRTISLTTDWRKYEGDCR